MARNRTVNTNDKYNIGIYLRLSREDGDDKFESNSITNQRNMLEDYVSLHNEEFEIYKVYVDDNYSGTNFNRPSFQEMILDIEQGLINCVIVKDLSRFGRDYIEVGNYLEKYFPEKGVRFIALNDNIDSLKQAYDILLPVKNIFNQQYAIDISGKVQSSFKTKQNKGEFTGAFASYGYLKDPKDNNKLIVDEYAAQIVRRIFQMYIDGMGQLKIAHVLNSEKILCPSEYKKMSGLKYKNAKRMNDTKYWTYSTIHRLLSNQMYRGDMVQNKTVRRMKGKAKYRPKEDWIIVEDTHQAIIDNETWERTQNLMSRNTRTLDFTQNVSVFAGFLKCSDCGRAMAKNKRGKTTYYICGSYKRYGSEICTSHTITHDKLEEIVIDYINVAINTIEDLKGLSESVKQNTPKVNNIDKEIEKVQITLDKIYNLKKGLYEDYKDGILTKDDYVNLKNDYDNNEKFHKEKIETLLKQNEESVSIFENPWLIKFLSNKKIEKLDRSILADIIEYIEIGTDKKVIITWNCPVELDELMSNI